MRVKIMYDTTVLRFSMLFEPGQGYEPPSKKARECPGSESRSPDPGPLPLDCSKPENNGADLRIRQVSRGAGDGGHRGPFPCCNYYARVFEVNCQSDLHLITISP